MMAHRNGERKETHKWHRVAVFARRRSNFIWGQLLLLGEGIPDPGDIFNTGSSLFKQISDKMGLAIPGTNWIGQAAEAYLNQNIAQQLRAQVMGDLDKLTGNMISNQAKYVSDTRDVLRAMKKMIDGVYKVCKGLEKIPLLGHLWSWSSQSLCPASRWPLSAAHCSI